MSSHKLKVEHCTVLVDYCVYRKDFDLVAKPYDKANLDKDSNMWRMSYSRKEQLLLRSIQQTAEYVMPCVFEFNH